MDILKNTTWSKIDPEFMQRGCIYIQGVDRVEIRGTAIPNYYRVRHHFPEAVGSLDWEVASRSHPFWDNWRVVPNR